jgi:hypothetical protein
MALGFVLCGSAAAQGSTAPLNAAVQPCKEAREPGHTAEDRLSACEKAKSGLDAAFAGMTDPRQHLRNVYHYNRAFVLSQIGEAHDGIEKGRSARFCEFAQAIWAEILEMKPAESPEGFMAAYDAMHASTARAMARCDVEKDSLPAGPPLP